MSLVTDTFFLSSPTKMDFDTSPRKRGVRRDEAAGEWFEDAESDADWIEDLSLVTTNSFLNDSSTMNTEELLEQNAVLNERLKQSETHLEQAQAENEKLKTQ